MKKHKNNSFKKFSLSNESVFFIRDYVIPYLKIINRIDYDTFYGTIADLAVGWEVNMVDENGYDRQGYKEESRDIAAMNFVSEISRNADDEIDIDDLNKRLGLQ